MTNNTIQPKPLSLGVCYYPEHWPEELWEQDAQEMVELGLTYVRVGEFAWSRIEPREGQYDFAWLDRSIEILSKAGLQIVFGLPTATPPKWLIDKYPSILAVDPRTGQTRGFGSRRHYDFSSPEYRGASNQINTKILERYGSNPAISVWQTDNELGCHDSTLSASENAKQRFQAWCKDRYQSIENLNEAWGTVFWSMEYNNFEQIELPVLTVTEAHPAHQLAYRRFSSDELISYQQDQLDLIRRYAPHARATHNYIPMSDTDADNFLMAKDLDFVSYDNYPLGRTDLFFANKAQSETQEYQRTGHPDYQSYYFDWMRGMNREGRNVSDFWVMEQQPGPVNWARYNPRPAPGMVHTWSMEAFAHGAECVSYFRWRQIPFGQEQMHAALKLRDNSPSDAWSYVEEVQKNLKQLNFNKRASIKSKVALLTDFDARCVTRIERQSDAYNFEQVEFSYYSALRQLGLDVDVVSTSSDLSVYELVVVPCLPIVTDDCINNFKNAINSGTKIFFGPRSGSKTDELSVPENLSPGQLQQIISLKQRAVETSHPDFLEALSGQKSIGQQLKSRIWREYFDLETDILSHLHYATGEGALFEQNNVFYLACLTEDESLKSILEFACNAAEIETLQLPKSIRIARRDDYCFVFNYGAEEYEIQSDKFLSDSYLIAGKQTIPAYSYAVFSNKQ